MFIFLTFISVNKIEKNVRFATFDFFDKIRINFEPTRNDIVFYAGISKIYVDVIMRPRFVFVVKNISPLFDCLMLHADLLYIYFKLINIGNYFVLF